MAGKRGNGEGSIFQRNDGKWCGVITTGRDAEGKLKRQYYYGDTRKVVSDKVLTAQSQLKAGNFIEPNRIKVSEWLDTWLKEYMKPKLRPTAYSGYESLIRVHLRPTIGNILLSELRPEHLQKLYNEKLEKGRFDGRGGLNSKSVRHIHVVLHSALGQAVKNQLVLKNVSDMASPPRLTKKSIRVLSLDEQIKLMNALDSERLGMAYKLDLATGLRLGELLALKWSDVNLNEGSIHVRQSLARVKLYDANNKLFEPPADDKSNVTQLIFQEPKTKSGNRGIPLLGNVLEELKEYKVSQDKEKNLAAAGYEDYGLVFCTKFGKPLHPDIVIQRFHKILQKAGVDEINFHALRHTFATRALESGMNPKVLQEILGHATITMTMDTYSHIMPDFKRSSIEKMDYIFNRNKDNGRGKGMDMDL